MGKKNALSALKWALAAAAICWSKIAAAELDSVDLRRLASNYLSAASDVKAGGNVPYSPFSDLALRDAMHFHYYVMGLVDGYSNAGWVCTPDRIKTVGEVGQQVAVELLKRDDLSSHPTSMQVAMVATKLWPCEHNKSR